MCLVSSSRLTNCCRSVEIRSSHSGSDFFLLTSSSELEIGRRHLTQERNWFPDLKLHSFIRYKISVLLNVTLNICQFLMPCRRLLRWLHERSCRSYRTKIISNFERKNVAGGLFSLSTLSRKQLPFPQWLVLLKSPDAKKCRT